MLTRMVALVSCLLLAGNGPTSQQNSLEQFVGKYPSDRIGARTFVTNPVVQRAVRAATWEPVVDREALSEGVTDKIQRKGPNIISSSCRPHSCDTVNWTIVMRLPAGPAAVCYHNETLMGDTSRWFVEGRATIYRGGCDWFKVPEAVLAALSLAR